MRLSLMGRLKAAFPYGAEVCAEISECAAGVKFVVLRWGGDGREFVC